MSLQWVLSHGVHDRWSELHTFDHAELEAALVPQTYLRHECVAFAGGAVLLDIGQWIVAHGNDRDCALYPFDRAILEAMLVSVASEECPG